MSSAVHISVLFFFISFSSYHVEAFYYTDSLITTTETPPEYEFLRLQTTTPSPVPPLSTDGPLDRSVYSNFQTTQSPSMLNSLLEECDDTEASDKDDKDGQTVGEESAEDVLHYVSALKDTDDVLQKPSSNFSTEPEHQRVQQQKLPLEEVKTDEAFPMTMIKSFKVTDAFGEQQMNNNQIEDDAPKNEFFRYTSPNNNRRPEPIKAAVFTRYSLESRPFSAFPTSQNDRRPYDDEPFLNEITSEDQPSEPQIIEVRSGNFRPLEIHFKSSSRRIKLVQRPPEKNSQLEDEVEMTRSEEEPQRLIHTINRPIIQEVHEYLYPQRRVIQEIHPVQETFHTIVATRTNKFNAVSNEVSRTGKTNEALRVVEPLMTTSSPVSLPIVESLADVEKQILEQTSSKEEEPFLTASQTSIRPMRVPAPRQAKPNYKPLFTTDNLLNSFLNVKKGSGEENDLVYHHLRSRKYRRNVTLKKRKSKGKQQLMRSL